MERMLSSIDYVVIAVFFAVMIGVGFYYSRRSKSSDQFFGNDKSVPWWLSGVSFYMNGFSALGTALFPDGPAERAATDAFFRRAETGSGA